MLPLRPKIIAGGLPCLLVLEAVLFGFLPPGYGQSVDKEVAGLAERMGKVLVAKGKPKLAVTDFADLQGRPTEFGRFLAEQLSVEFVNTPGISVVDRANLKSILAEHKLSEEGLINPETAKKLGQFAGVDVILIGTVTELDNDLAVTVKAIATDTAEIVAASKAAFGRTKEIQQLAVHAVGGPANPGATVAKSGPAAPIATKDFGDLRVTLKSIRRAKVSDYGQSKDGIECRFEFANTNLRERILCAGNGEESHQNVFRAHMRSPSGDVLVPAEVRGLTGVCVYGRVLSPSAIAQTIVSGQHIEGSRAYYDHERLWQGDLTTIPASDSIQVAITFAAGYGQRPQPIAIDNLQLDLELVVGTGVRRTMSSRGAELPNNARLYTLNLDGLSVSDGAK